MYLFSLTQSIISKKVFFFISVVIFIIQSYPATAQIKTELDRWPQQVEINLNKSGKNRSSLEKVLVHYKNDRDTLKYKAAVFLISNMDIHYSKILHWKDSAEKLLDYNELSFKNYELAEDALNSLKLNKHIQAVQHISWDLESMDGDFLIQQIESAFNAWRLNTYRNVSFNDFCEYILPYRVTREPLEDWRDKYRITYQAISDSLAVATSPSQILANFGDKSYNDFHFIAKHEPHTIRGGLQLLFRNQGDCDDAATMETFALRSQGIPASFNIIPYWGTTSGRHYVCTTFDKRMMPLPLYSEKQGQSGIILPREPSKVLRVTYSKRPETLATHKDINSIPAGFLQTTNYLDVTQEYWSVADVTCPVWQQDEVEITYAAIFNRGSWNPVWWAKPKAGYATFSQMPMGLVVLPMRYYNGKLSPIGYPKTNSVTGSEILKPDFNNHQTIKIFPQDKYLIFKLGAKYTLYYWNKDWIKAGEQVFKADMQDLSFEHVPSNSLYILIPEYSIGLERPFSMSSTGERNWF